MDTNERTPEVIVCEDCGEPLIGTMMFPYKEWLCAKCGTVTEFLGNPRVEDPDGTLRKKRAELAAKYFDISFDIVGQQCQRTDCEKCNTSSENHVEHMSDEQKAADRAARKRLNEWLGKELCTETYP